MILIDRLRYLFATLLILLLAASCTSTESESMLKDGDSVLFVGNSKVGSEGGLQNHFRRTLARAEPPLTIDTYWENMFNRATLADMYTDELVERITGGPDSIIVVSDGIQEEMQRFADLIGKQAKRMVLFATWADNPFLEENSLDEFYQLTQVRMDRAAQFGKNNDIPVVPSGLIFYDLIMYPPAYERLRPDYLFVPGSSVQNDLGTLVNVAAIYAVLTGRSPVGLPIWDPFPAELVTAIEERVWKIVQNWQDGLIEVRPVDEYRPPEPLLDVVMDTTQALWPPLIQDRDSILYVGNSYIGSEGGLNNHFSRMLREVTPPMQLSTSSRIFWGQGLQNMYTEEVRKDIADEDYDLVVVTSGPVEVLQQFREDIQAAGSRMMVHMTWGRNPTINEEGMEGYRRQTEEIVAAMREFENSTGVPVAPCGLVFYDLITNPPSFEDLRLDWVYMVENIHQNHLGTMVNAATHYAVMTGRSPVGLPMWEPYPEALVKEIQERAWKVVQDWKAGKVDIQ
ncbi:MAG: hypothetical protein R2824_27795 [Saprospiraceae bacterium]|nr:hypothetical protein [Lewinella sp.]